MKMLFYFFEGMVDFEISFLIALLSTPGWDTETIAVSEDNQPVKSAYGISFIPHKKISEIDDLEEIDGLVITGGLTKSNSNELNKLIRKIDSEGKLLASICFGPMQLARAGVLKDRRYTTTALPPVLKEMRLNDPFEDRTGFVNKPLVRDGNIITATATAFIDFSIEIADYIGLIPNEFEKKQIASLYKNI